MTKTFLLVIGLIFSFGCKKSDPSMMITIVDIAYLDRVGIANLLEIINKYSPKVVGLDFMLTTDSLTKDELLKEQLAQVKNLVQSSILHGYRDTFNYWDSLETYHSKFGHRDAGFTNITISADSVFVPELPMRQYYRDQEVMSLSYVIAERAFGVDAAFRDGQDRDFYFDQSKIGKYFTVITPEQLLEEKFNSSDLDGKIVILGHVSDDEDCFFIDTEKTRRISGVEIQASLVSQILSLQ
jgi:CHASE2 domain-containing sensor protein